MSSYTLTPQFIRDFQALEPDMSPADVEIFDTLLATIVRSPQPVPRVQSFYDPQKPSWLSRSGPFVIHYAFDAQADEVTFINVFRHR
jgi:hypothetical protein